MEAYRTDTVVEKDGSITINGLPFREGEELEVILLQRVGQSSRVEPYPLRGEPVNYVEPFEGAAEGDWGASN